MPHFVLFLEYANEVCCLRQLGGGGDKYSELWDSASIGKRELIDDVDDIVSYTISHNSANVLCGWSSGLNVIERVCLIREEAKGNARKYLKTMGEGINPALHARVVIERVTVKVAKL